MEKNKKRYQKPEILVHTFKVEKGFAISAPQEITIRENFENDILQENGYSHHVASSFDRHSSSESGWDI